MLPIDKRQYSGFPQRRPCLVSQPWAQSGCSHIAVTLFTTGHFSSHAQVRCGQGVTIGWRPETEANSSEVAKEKDTFLIME